MSLSLPINQQRILVTVRQGGHDDPLSYLGSMDARAGAEGDVCIRVDRMMQHMVDASRVELHEAQFRYVRW